MEGGKQLNQYDTDTEPVFRQDSWFNFLFGVHESEFYGAVNINTNKCTLFMPRLPEVYKIWCGSIHPPEHFKDLYVVDEVVYSDELESWLKNNLNNNNLFLLSGENSDSGLMAKPAEFESKKKFINSINITALFPALTKARITKSLAEIEVMRYSSYIASEAHVETMKSAYVGMMEFELEAKFRYEIYSKGGCRNCAYTSICACGPNAAVLHYGHAGAPNDRQLGINDLALLDQGAEYHGYVSDITCSYPVNDDKCFNNQQKIVYTAVLEAQIAVMRAIRPGASWTDMHLIAYRAILSILRENNLVIGDLDTMIDADIGAVFMPHGLGHLIGCDTHDVGGYLNVPDASTSENDYTSPERSSRPGLKSLRTARILEAGMVLTNEPGCYFIDTLLDEAKNNVNKNKYLNFDIIDTYRGIGGVRLEDVVVVVDPSTINTTEDDNTAGVVNLTTCPRTIREVETALQGGCWPPVKDEAPELRRLWCKMQSGRIIDVPIEGGLIYAFN